MSASNTHPETLRPVRTRGEQLESLAFMFCKSATLVLLASIAGQRFILPLIALGAAALYVLAYFNGKKDTRCVGRYPLAIAGFWLLVAGLAVWLALRSAGEA